MLRGAVDRSPHGGLQLASGKAGGAYTNTVAHESQKICFPQNFLGWLRYCYTNVQNQEILPNKVGGPGGQGCKKDLCRQRIVLVPRTSGMDSGP